MTDRQEGQPGRERRAPTSSMRGSRTRSARIVARRLGIRREETAGPAYSGQGPSPCSGRFTAVEQDPERRFHALYGHVHRMDVFGGRGRV